MYLPVDAQAQVAIGDKVTGVSTVLARLPLTDPQAEPVSQAASVETALNQSAEQH